MIDKIYHGILWFCGFQNKEHISDMLARSRIRLGIFWSILVILTFALDLVWFVTMFPSWWDLVPGFLFFFFCWLTDHILKFAPREGHERFTRKHLT